MLTTFTDAAVTVGCAIRAALHWRPPLSGSAAARAIIAPAPGLPLRGKSFLLPMAASVLVCQHKCLNLLRLGISGKPVDSFGGVGRWWDSGEHQKRISGLRRVTGRHPASGASGSQAEEHACRTGRLPATVLPIPQGLGRDAAKSA